ncbi:hypothetical protein K470DRAFT_222762 [Piedraia hortae CBS 480.64]|uniref:Uncharacterized protein n=1 Tax=Piedraia hortae CBS 480.64 TaxID=1314780 RepID=A0A6A7BS39_9PEZI|nr:hypothetical protein K470DRAFT_222762 [Piedraia hortae CBS 480.64]
MSRKKNSPYRPKFSLDSEAIAVSLDYGFVSLWLSSSGTEEARLTGHLGPVKASSFAENGQLLLPVPLDGTVCIWDIPTESFKRQLEFSSSNYMRLSFSPGAKTLVGLSKDWEVFILALDTR